MFNKKEIEYKYPGTIHNTDAEVIYAINKVADEEVDNWKFNHRHSAEALKYIVQEEAQRIWYEHDFKDRVCSALPVADYHRFADEVYWSNVLFARFDTLNHDGEKWILQ